MENQCIKSFIVRCGKQLLEISNNSTAHYLSAFAGEFSRPSAIRDYNYTPACGFEKFEGKIVIAKASNVCM